MAKARTIPRPPHPQPRPRPQPRQRPQPKQHPPKTQPKPPVTTPKTPPVTTPPVTKPPTPPKSMKERLKEFRKRQLTRDLKYESGRREIKYQLPVRSTHSLVTNIIGVDVPKPMWEHGGGGKRSYTSTYKSRRQARSSAHRAKLQRRGF